jgi:hypothetical protein
MSELTNFLTSFNERIKEVEVFLSIVRASELQEAACKKLGELLKEIAAEKVMAIKDKNEDYANLLLGCECVAHALIAELRMWLLLKEEKPDAAWDQLVDAQMSSVSASQAHDGFLHLEQHYKKLLAIEHLVFPPQVFVSSGFIVRHQECSICGAEYGECQHLVGKPYMGKFCHIIARDIELDHVSIVEHPADKRCRVQQFDAEGGTRNRMTWRVEAKKETHNETIQPTS